MSLAEKKANNIRVSVVDVSDISNYSELGYYMAGGGFLEGGIRTIGVDFARKRDPGIIQLMDVDTVPASNDTLSNLINHYREHPEVKIAKSGMAYQLPGETLPLSPGEALFRIADYAVLIDSRYGGTSSTQISFRADLASELDFVSSIRNYPKVSQKMDTHVPGFRGDWEDEDSWRHLLLNPNNISIFQKGEVSFLTMDRLDGTTDGSTRLTKSLDKFGDLVAQADKAVEEVIFRIDGLPTEKKEEAITMYKQALKKHEKSTLRIHRFYREAARRIIELRESGDIKLKEDSVEYSENARNNPFFRSIDRYIRTHGKFLTSCTDSDWDYLKYVLKMNNESQEDQTDDKKIAIKEWFGNTDSSRLISAQIKIQAASDVYKQFFAREDLLAKVAEHQEGEGLSLSEQQILEEIGVIKSDRSVGFGKRTQWYDRAIAN